MIRANYIDCPTKAIFNTWTLPQNAEDKNGDIGWTTTVYIKDTGEIWMYGNIWGGSYSEVTDNSIVLSIGGVKYTLSLNNHTQSYTTLTGSTTIADQAILSSGVENQWVLKTLGKNAFSNEDYLPANSPAVAVENALTIKYGKSDSTLATYDGSAPTDVKLQEGDNISFILGSEGELIINAQQNDDTTNTSGATNLPNTKLFIIGATEQSESPQTYSNTSVYIGADNQLYSNGKEVSTSDHNHDTKYLIKSGDTMSGILSMSDDIKFIADKYIKYEDSVILGYNSDSNAIIIANSAFPTKIYSNESELIHVKNGTEYTILDVGNYINTLDTRYITLDTSQTVTGLKTFNNIILAENQYIFGGTSETNNEMLGFHLGKTIIGSIGESTTEPTHIRSKTGHITVGTGDEALYTILDTGNYASILDDKYVNVSGDTITGILTINYNSYPQLKINNGSGGYSIIRFQSGDVDKAAVGYSTTVGALLQNKADSNNYINIKSDNLLWNNASKFWHEGNDGAGSGLDAGLLCSYDESKFYRSAISTVNGETALSNIPADRSGSYQLTHSGWTGAAHIFYAGGSNSTFGFMLPGGNNNTVKVISCTNSNSGEWKELGTLAYTSGNVSSADNADNADKLDGVHLNGIFTAFTASGNNTRLTIGGVTKDLTVPYASNADMLDGVHNGSLTAAVLASQGNKTAISGTDVPDSGVRLYQVYNNGYPAAYGNLLSIKGGGCGELLLSWKNTNRIFYRSRSDVSTEVWQGWSTVAFLTDNVASATKSDYPTGFSSRTTSSTWGNTTGTCITDWKTSTGGEIAFMNDNPSSGQLSVKIDGVFYQDEGRYKVLDTGTYAATLDSHYLRVGDSESSSVNSKYLTFANNSGGVAGKMGDNDYWRMYGRSTASNSGYLEIATADDAGEPIYIRQYSGVFTTLKRTLTLLDGSGNTSIPGNLTVSGKISVSNEISASGRITSSRSGVNTVSTLASLPVTKDVVLANLSAATNLTLASTMTVGDCITIIVNPTSSFEQPLPTASGWSSLDGDSIQLSSGKLAEISILCYATGKYSVSCKTAS